VPAKFESAREGCRGRNEVGRLTPFRSAPCLWSPPPLSLVSTKPFCKVVARRVIENKPPELNRAPGLLSNPAQGVKSVTSAQRGRASVCKSRLPLDVAVPSKLHNQRVIAVHKTATPRVFDPAPRPGWCCWLISVSVPLPGGAIYAECSRG